MIDIYLDFFILIYFFFSIVAEEQILLATCLKFQVQHKIYLDIYIKNNRYRK